MIDLKKKTWFPQHLTLELFNFMPFIFGVAAWQIHSFVSQGGAVMPNRLFKHFHM